MRSMRRAPGGRLPGRLRRREVEGQVQLVAVAVVRRDPRRARERPSRRSGPGRRRRRRPDAASARMWAWVLGARWRRSAGSPTTAARRRAGPGSRPMQCTTSIRKPSTPRSSQKRMTSCIASDHLRVVPVQVRLLGEELVQVPLLGRRVPGPGPAALDEGAPPVVRRNVGPAAVPPHVPVPLGGRPVSARDSTNHGCWSEVWLGTRSTTTRMPELVGVGEEAVEGGQVAEERVDVAEVGHVVAEVGHRRAVERRQPDGVDTQPGQVVEVAAGHPPDPRCRRRRRRRRSGGTPGRRPRSATRGRGRGRARRAAYGPPTSARSRRARAMVAPTSPLRASGDVP